MVKEWGRVIKKEKPFLPQFRNQFKNIATSRIIPKDEFRRRKQTLSCSSSSSEKSLRPFEAKLDERGFAFNPFEHRDPSEVFDDPFEDGIQLRLFDPNKGTKSRGRTGNLFGF